MYVCAGMVEPIKRHSTTTYRRSCGLLSLSPSGDMFPGGAGAFNPAGGPGVGGGGSRPGFVPPRLGLGVGLDTHSRRGCWRRERNEDKGDKWAGVYTGGRGRRRRRRRRQRRDGGGPRLNGGTASAGLFRPAEAEHLLLLDGWVWGMGSGWPSPPSPSLHESTAARRLCVRVGLTRRSGRTPPAGRTKCRPGTWSAGTRPRSWRPAARPRRGSSTQRANRQTRPDGSTQRSYNRP